MTSDDEGGVGVMIPPKNDDVIYEQPLISFGVREPAYFIVAFEINPIIIIMNYEMLMITWGGV